MLIVFLEQLQICISFSQRTYCKWEKNISRTKLMQAELADIFICVVASYHTQEMSYCNWWLHQAYKLIFSIAGNIMWPVATIILNKLTDSLASTIYHG